MISETQPTEDPLFYKCLYTPGDLVEFKRPGAIKCWAIITKCTWQNWNEISFWQVYFWCNDGFSSFGYKDYEMIHIQEAFRIQQRL